MTKVSVVLYYWILVAAALLFARTAGLADNNSAIIKILIVITILYVGVVMISLSLGKNRAKEYGNNRNSGQSKRAGNGQAAASQKKRKK
ncbi:hypothetical protein FRZ06_02260 [Anoxybacterium hadale]|uniref:Uncharacterized protein n=1 Tax=Anoxybacterium hadale TaxID=3408580 RepID=A0ACD1A7K9_9FIRM|nr:hypothetical protein FRZ06_02260 [Clostridiales bacterium]